MNKEETRKCKKKQGNARRNKEMQVKSTYIYILANVESSCILEQDMIAGPHLSNNVSAALENELSLKHICSFPERSDARKSEFLEKQADGKHLNSIFIQFHYK